MTTQETLKDLKARLSGNTNCYIAIYSDWIEDIDEQIDSHKIHLDIADKRLDLQLEGFGHVVQLHFEGCQADYNNYHLQMLNPFGYVDGIIDIAFD